MARTKTGFFFVKTLNGAPPAMKQYPVVAATAYYEGAVLRISATSGSATKFEADGTAVLGVSAANISLARSSYATTRLPVYLADNNNVFEAQQGGVSLSDCQDVMHDLIDIEVANENYRLGSASSKQCRVVGFHPDDVAKGATGARLWVTFAKNLLTDKASEPR